MKKTILCAAFCGCGKTYLCNNSNIAIEIEYWKYKDGLQAEYIRDIKNSYGSVEYIFISTDPEGLELLHKEGYEITLVYPENSLREEYLNRYIQRDSPYEFIGVFMKHWHDWINELKAISYCKHIVLKPNQYLKDIITEL